MSILSSAGDHLPVWTTRVKQDGKKTLVRLRATHKDGEAPGEEWTRQEVAAIRALSNPKTSNPKAAAKIAGIAPKTIARWMRNPYFMNEVWKLTNSFLQQARTRVLNAVIENAVSGSYQDRNLFLRLTGDLKTEDKRTPLKKNDFDDNPPDDWIQADIDALNENFRTRVKRKTRRRN